LKVVINAVSAKMGGAITYTTNVLRCLPPPESGYEFDVFLPPETAERQKGLPRNVRLVATSVGHGAWGKRFWWEQVTLRRFLRRERVDVLFSTANFAMFRCPVKQILLVRNAVYFSKLYQEMIVPRQSLKRRTAFWLGRWLIGCSVRNADVVMTPTQAMLDELREYVEVPPHKAMVNAYGAEVHNGVAGTFPAPSGHEDTSGPSPMRLLYVSLYAEHKNLDTLLKAMPLLNRDGGRGFVLKTTANPHWELVRNAVGRLEDIALAQAPEIARCVQFVGPLGKREVERLYLGSDLFVFPSFIESFGFPMVEAMAYGLPIVAADTPVNREICGESALYFRTWDPDDLAEKVRLLSANEALRQQCSESGRRRAASRFKWQDHATRLLGAVGHLVR
jgi:glycosyltransferase involved in cell wall biosynthesis